MVDEGVKREVMEETQLEIDLVSPLRPFDTIFMSNNQVALHVVYIDYLAKLTGDELKTGSDVGEAIWIEKEHIPQIWAGLHDDTKRLLQIAGVVETPPAQ